MTLNFFLNSWAWRCRRLAAWLLLAMAHVLSPAFAGEAAATVDLPACERAAPGMTKGLALGVVQPFASDHVLAYVGRLTQADPSLNVCAEAWSSVLPRWVPWAHELERFYGFAFFALAFVLVVTVLWRLTPRHWWRRTTLLGLGGVLAGTWLVGVGLVAAFHALGGQQAIYGTVVSMRLPQQPKPVWFDVAGARELESLLSQAGALKTPTKAAPTAGVSPPLEVAPATSAQAPAGRYRAAHRLNVRAGPGVQHAHVVTLARGADVQFDGAVQGDWWRIRTEAGVVGWSSSLWLRQPAEISKGQPASGAPGAAAVPAGS